MHLDKKNNEQHNSGAFDPFRSQDGSSGYYYDCIWRCVSYIRNKDGSARDAANIAYRFLNTQMLIRVDSSKVREPQPGDLNLKHFKNYI